MLKSQENILKTLAGAKPSLVREYGLKEIALFGSYARNEQHESSDIDIMVELNHSQFNTFCELADILDGLFPLNEVQVVSKHAIKPGYFEHVKQDLLYV
jgi:predicted nucleotidyltransferase